MTFVDRRPRLCTAHEGAGHRCEAGRTQMAEEGLPPGWQSATDAKNRTYYYNKREGAKQWQRLPTSLRVGRQ